jgi:Methyltransferase domain
VSRVDFDQYAGQYEDILAAQTNFFDGDSGYFARYKIELAQRLAGSVSSVLDFGCGIGRSMPYLREVFPKAEIVGCDPSAESFAIARRENPSCRFASMDDLGADAKFDLDRLLRLSPHPAAGSADGHPLLLQPPERRRTLHHLRTQSDQSGSRAIWSRTAPSTRTRYCWACARRSNACPTHICISTSRATACSSRSSSRRFARSRNICAGCRWAGSISSALPIKSVTSPDRGFRQPGRPSGSLRNVLTAFCAP